jgi:hypothetical protein
VDWRSLQCFSTQLYTAAYVPGYTSISDIKTPQVTVYNASDSTKKVALSVDSSGVLNIAGDLTVTGTISPSFTIVTTTSTVTCLGAYTGNATFTHYKVGSVHHVHIRLANSGVFTAAANGLITANVPAFDSVGLPAASADCGVTFMNNATGFLSGIWSVMTIDGHAQFVFGYSGFAELVSGVTYTLPDVLFAYL